MKKYVKPELYFESYEVNQNIAACRWDLNLKSKEECAAEYDTNMKNAHNAGMFLFTEAPRCNVTEEKAFDYCYFNGAAEAKLFQS